MNAEATSVRATKPVGAGLPGAWSAPPSDAALRAVVRLMLLPLRLLATPLGRRLAAAAVLSVALVAMVSSLYAHAEGPDAPSARALRAAPAAATKPATAPAARPAPATQRDAAPAAATAAARATQRAAERPEDAATAWFARQRGVPVNRVTALQRQRVSATVTRVMVMAEIGPSDMPTAFVTVRRDGAGWKVT
jgi:hypothetical protein